MKCNNYLHFPFFKYYFKFVACKIIAFFPQCRNLCLSQLLFSEKNHVKAAYVSFYPSTIFEAFIIFVLTFMKITLTSTLV